jgi:glutaminyl-tRNA synthetase
MGSYIIKFVEAKTDENGNVVEIICTADLETRNGNPVDGRKVKGTIHWLSAENYCECEVAEFDKLFTIENTGAIAEGQTYDDYLNVESVKIIKGCKAEKCLENAKSCERFQFVRTGYFCKDSKHENRFNRIVELKDSKPVVKGK